MAKKQIFKSGLCGLLFLCLAGLLYPQASTRNIVVYFPEWGIYDGHNNYFPEHVPFNNVTHVNFAFLEVVKAGTDTFNLNIIDPWASLEITDDWSYGPERTGCINRLSYQRDHFFPHVKLLFSVGGWSRCGYFSELAATGAGRASFAASCVAFLRQYNYDGIDIDWEYPGVERAPSGSPPGDQGNPVVGDDRANFTLLLRDVRQALDAAGQADGKTYLLTIAAACGYDKIDLTEPGAYHQYLDFINVMSYDIHGPWDERTNHQAALFPNPADPSPTAPINIKDNYNADYALRHFRTLGVPAGKLNLGIPYYGRGWQGVESDGENGLFASHGGAAASGLWDGFSAPYYQLRGWAAGSNGFQLYRDAAAGVPWLYSPAAGEMWTHEDPPSVQAKSQYVLAEGYGGVIVWDITGDYPSEPGREGLKGSELGDAIYAVFADPDYTPTPAPSPTPVPTGYPAWDPEAIYVEGDIVSHNGFDWIALWWTRNQEPGTNAVWELLGAPTPEPVLPGDVNGDGSVTIVDALMTAQYYVGLQPPRFQPSAADVDCSGGITIVDALQIAQYYVGLLGSLGDC